MELISTVGLGLLSSVIYDTVKFVTGKFIGKIEACKKEKDLLDRINQELYVGVSDECKTVLNSSNKTYKRLITNAAVPTKIWHIPINMCFTQML